MVMVSVWSLTSQKSKWALQIDSILSNENVIRQIIRQITATTIRTCVITGSRSLELAVQIHGLGSHKHE